MGTTSIRYEQCISAWRSKVKNLYGGSTRVASRSGEVGIQIKKVLVWPKVG